jgi:hypothetical protein
MNKTSAAPDIPDEIANKRPIALSPMAAETGDAELPPAKGKLSAGLAAYNAKKKAGKGGKKSANRALFEKLSLGEPRAGKTWKEIQEISGRSYPGMPKADPMLGDKDPRVKDWLIENQPEDAAVRYAYRIGVPA